MKITNPTSDELRSDEWAVTFPANGTVDVDETVAAAFAEHPVLRVTDDAGNLPVEKETT